MCLRICIYIMLTQSPASRRGRDKRGRRRSAAIPPNELSRGNVGNARRHIATCGKLSQHVATCAHLNTIMLHTVGERVPSVRKNNACPDPAWKPVTLGFEMHKQASIIIIVS